MNILFRNLMNLSHVLILKSPKFEPQLKFKPRLKFVKFGLGLPKILSMLEKTLDNSEEKISVKVSLMDLVQNNHVVRAQASIAGNLKK